MLHILPFQRQLVSKLQRGDMSKNRIVDAMSIENVSDVMSQWNVSLYEPKNKTCDSVDCFLILTLFTFLNYLLFDLIKELLYDMANCDWLFV